MTPTPNISLVVPTYRRAERICSLLDHLSRQSLPAADFEVVVVDNFSDDDTSARVRTRALGLPFTVQLIRMTCNRGPAAARNAGWRAARAPLIAFADDDVTPDRDWLQAGVTALERDPTVGVLQGRTLLPPEQETRDVHYGPPDWKVVHIIEGPTAHFEGCNLFFRRDALEGSGGFDESIGWWGEDTAAGWRVVDAGWKRGFAPDAVVTHPLEQRGWMWFVRNGLLERNMVVLGVTHPGFRAEAFWRSWAFRREDAAFALALVGGVAAVWFLPALALLAPYAWLRRPSIRQRSFFRLCVQIPVVDAARFIGHLRGSVSARTLVL